MLSKYSQNEKLEIGVCYSRGRHMADTAAQNIKATGTSTVLILPILLDDSLPHPKLNQPGSAPVREVHYECFHNMAPRGKSHFRRTWEIPVSQRRIDRTTKEEQRRAVRQRTTACVNVSVYSDSLGRELFLLEQKPRLLIMLAPTVPLKLQVANGNVERIHFHDSASCYLALRLRTRLLRGVCCIRLFLLLWFQ